jgi:hypothetical protein
LPIYRHFFIEKLGADGWGVPPGFEAEPWTFEDDRVIGGFAWAHPGRPWLQLFWGEEALFPMRPGAPEVQRGSALLRKLARECDNCLHHDVALCWIPYTDLCIDSWDTESLILRTQIPARHALLFENGQRRFPRDELLEAGLTARELDRLENGFLAEEAVDHTVGLQRFRLSETPAHYLVTVTWSATIAEFIGEPHARLFTELRRYGPDEELRILSKRG